MKERPSKPRPGLGDYQHALDSMDTFIDVNVTDLMDLARRAEEFAERRSASNLAVGQAMSHPVISVRAQTPLTVAARQLVSHRISGLPVVDEHDRLLGIITEADFLRALGVVSPHSRPTLWQTLEALFSHIRQHASLQTPDAPTADHMVKDVVTVAPEQALESAVELMQQHAIKRLVVCEEERRVVGVLTRSDLVRVFFDRYKA